VVLLQVPLLLHAAWQLQAESVLREYLLTRLGDTGIGDLDESEHDAEVEEELGEHAAVHEAIVLLQENLPAPDLGDHPDDLLSTAVEPHVTADRLVFRVPTESLDNFARMEATLDAAMQLAENGGLLTPPTQPEVRQFRRWLCREVRDQRAGKPPRPWRLDFGPEDEPAGAAPSWDPSEVDTAEKALIAAADTNRMVAVSPAAARLLGYASGAELVGRRLVDIIPTRFRQAHLAGFTLHLFAGRSPLLGHPVRVPALRKDGSEVAIELLVDAVSLTGGRHVYLAEITEAGSPP
jgi:PAS domain S-box-containing protein